MKAEQVVLFIISSVPPAPPTHQMPMILDTRFLILTLFRVGKPIISVSSFSKLRICLKTRVFTPHAGFEHKKKKKRFMKKNMYAPCP